VPSFFAANEKCLKVSSVMGDLTRILLGIEPGDRYATDQLLPLIYDELRKLANQKLANEKAGQTLQATALVHEAYLRLVGPVDKPHWEGRRHFYAAAAEAMRRILIEKARRKRGPKQGGQLQRVDADLDAIVADVAQVDILALDEALTRLAEESPVRAKLVKLRFFAGVTMAEAASMLGISLATAERYWTYARTRLFAELNDHPARGNSAAD
jgi:RNA polymerase sigma factor (TIGR02999 family)